MFSSSINMVFSFDPQHDGPTTIFTATPPPPPPHPTPDLPVNSGGCPCLGMSAAGPSDDGLNRGLGDVEGLG